MADSILVIKLGALGDVIQALGPMAAIRAHHSQARIMALTAKAFAPLIAASPYADEVWIDARPAFWNLGGIARLRTRLRAGNFSRVYDLQTSDRSSFYFRLFPSRARPQWSGIARGCSHPHANPARDRMHTIDRQADQLAIAGIARVPPPDIAWLRADIARFALPRPFGLLIPGGSARRPEKRWPAARYGELAKKLAGRGLTPVVIGLPEEAPLATEIAAICPTVRDLTGQTSLAEIAALARAAAVAVGNDTGPMHLSAVVGCHSVVLFSAASDPALCAPRGARVTVLRRADLAALPAIEVAATLPAA
ncbi:MAG: glycosyltransferase family 9 protein [Rhodospirillales bacterium]|nr:glycosyltransferase family 9 protein [Rhodospirillales bacterium]